MEFKTCLFLPLIIIRPHSKHLPLKGKFPQLLKRSLKARTHLYHPALSPAWPLPAAGTNQTAQTAHIQNILALFLLLINLRGRGHAHACWAV